MSFCFSLCSWCLCGYYSASSKESSMTRFGAIIAVCLLTLPLHAADVKVWQEDLILLTYPLYASERMPRFTRNDRPLYPYSLAHSELGENPTEKAVEKAWHAVFLENEYLKVIVLPDLGGKLYSIFDKVTGREVLYRNHVVKYADVGIRGAWTSRGIEWNFPDGHTVTAISPVDFTTHQDRDGSATITVGD